MQPTTMGSRRRSPIGPSLRLQANGRPVGAMGRRLAIAFVVGGAVLALAAGVLLAPHVVRARSEPIGADDGGRSPAQGRFPNVGVTERTYEPGQSSGWHVHPGVHSVVVLAGTLSVYDAACERHDFGPGETYLGGTFAHLARNETDEPVRMAVTTIFVVGSPLDHPSAVEAPTGCDVR